jgi:hypothetical protein
MHDIEVDASSLFDGANQAMRAWSRFWWFDYQRDLTVRRGEDSWQWRQDVVQARRERRNVPPNRAGASFICENPRCAIAITEGDAVGCLFVFDARAKLACLVVKNCCGCLNVTEHGTEADLVCNECGELITTLAIADLEKALAHSWLSRCL